MFFELDHLFILVAAGGPEAARLIELGLVEGAANRHPGQGTANRRFFFHNAFLELVWVDDPVEAQSEVAARTRLWERWHERGRGASSFGICLRPCVPHSTSASAPQAMLPFDHWEYCPPYLPAPLVIKMGTNSERVDEPLLFSIDFNRRPDAYPVERRQPFDHPLGLRNITRVRLTAPPAAVETAELRAVERACPWVSFSPGGDDLAELGFDGETAGHSHDFRPDLSLVMKW
jgi:hypothetical protein